MIDERLDGTRLAGDGFVEAEKRFLMLAQFFQDAATIVPSIRIRWIESESHANTLEGLFVAIEGHQCQTAIALGFHHARFELQSGIKADQRFGRTVQPLQGAAARKER